MYCSNCGSNQNDFAKFCPNCGQHIRGDIPTQNRAIQYNSNTINRETVLKTLSQKENTAGTIWLVIGCIQVAVGLLSLFTYWVAILLGAWNIYAAITRFKQSKRVLSPWPSMVSDYKKWNTNVIISLIANIFLGALIGVVGSIYDLTLRNYVMLNENVINGAIQQNSKTSS